LDWLLPGADRPDNHYRAVIGGHPLVAEVLYRRGITSIKDALAFLDPDEYTPAPPTELPDVDVAASRLLEAVRRHERILVWGDFDVDGQTATALLVDALRALGAQVTYHVPNRLKDGHGVQEPVLRRYLSGPDRVDVILTCDTGIAAHEAAEAAYVNGIDLLITDHHALPPELPKAPALVATQRLPPGHVLRDLPGVGVAFKVMQHLYALAGRSGEEHRLLDLVALGIVADVVIQRHDTRYLLQRGMDLLRSTQRTGLRALIEAAQVDPTNLATDTIGFQIGPRLNALGRLGDANKAVELLTTANESYAQQLAAQLNVLNDRRKLIENQIYTAALEQIAQNSSLLDYEALVIDGPEWHPGVIGIVASRLVEQYGKPTVVLSLQEGQPARGSARSVPGVDISAAIAAAGEILLTHGGHPGAAGLSLPEERVEQFRRLLSNAVAELRDPSVRQGRQVDAVVRFGDLSMEVAEQLNRLAPFGEGNPPVHLMVENTHLVEQAAFGAKGQHLRMTVKDSQGTPFTVTWWRGSDSPAPPERFDLLFIPRINDYRGRRSLQLEWVDSRPVPGLEITTGPRYELVDLRKEEDKLSRLPAKGAVLWAEGLHSKDLPQGLPSARRFELPRAAALVIWTAPPSLATLAAALERTGARTVYVVASDGAGDSPREFLQRLGGLVKHTLREKSGVTTIVELAGSTGQCEVTVRRGLNYLAALGKITVQWPDADLDQDDPQRLEAGQVRFSRSTAQPDTTSLESLQANLLSSLAETRAFRSYFRTAGLRSFFM